MLRTRTVLIRFNFHPLFNQLNSRAIEGEKQKGNDAVSFIDRSIDIY